MKATELRIGNKVLNDNVENTVVAIASANLNIVGLETMQGNLINAGIDRIKPIPLTEEWLLEFGCGKKEINDYYKETDDFGILFYHEINFNGGWFTLGINSDNEYYLCDSGYDLDDKDSMASFACGLPSIKYVHQLQNLFFALTGEELEIKTN